MSNHRYEYLYAPIAAFLKGLTPEKQALLTVAKLSIITALLCFQIASVAAGA